MLQYFYLDIRGSFFCALLEGGFRATIQPNLFPENGRCRHESEDHFGLHRVQAAQLQHNEKQEEQSRQT